MNEDVYPICPICLLQLEWVMEIKKGENYQCPICRTRVFPSALMNGEETFLDKRVVYIHDVNER